MPGQPLIVRRKYLLRAGFSCYAARCCLHSAEPMVEKLDALGRRLRPVPSSAGDQLFHRSAGRPTLGTALPLRPCLRDTAKQNSRYKDVVFGEAWGKTYLRNFLAEPWHPQHCNSDLIYTFDI